MHTWLPYLEGEKDHPPPVSPNVYKSGKLTSPTLPLNEWGNLIIVQNQCIFLSNVVKCGNFCYIN